MQHTVWITLLGAMLFVQDCGPDGGDDDTPGDDDDSSTPGDACPVSSDARTLIEDAVQKILMDTFHVATYSDASDRGFSLQLVGVEQGYIGFMSLAFTCTEPVRYDPYCEGSFAASGEPADPFWLTRDRCSRLGCEAADVGLVDVYFTMKPHSDPDDRHAFTYETVTPEGSAVFDPNPFVTWRIDLTDPQKVVVTSELERIVEIATAGETLEFTHTGEVSVTRAGELTTGDLTLQFPSLAPDDAIDVRVELLASGGSTGAVTAGTRQLATISGHEADFTWEAECAF